MDVRERRLEEDLVTMTRLSRQSSLIDFVVDGPPPEEYLVTFRCRGMIDAGRQGPALQECLHPVEFLGAPPRLALDGSVLAIANPAADADAVGAASGRPSEADALNSPLDAESRRTERICVTGSSGLYRRGICVLTR